MHLPDLWCRGAVDIQWPETKGFSRKQAISHPGMGWKAPFEVSCLPDALQKALLPQTIFLLQISAFPHVFFWVDKLSSTGAMWRKWKSPSITGKGQS